MILLRYWPAAAAILVLAGLFAYHRHAIGNADKAGYERAVAKMQNDIANANAKARSDEQAAQNRANEVDRAHQKQIADIAARYAARPIPAVRVCRPARQVRVPAATTAAAIDHGPADAGGLPGRDIGPDLERIARAADEQTARLIACQAFIRGTR